jgi:hypothetical protein
MFMVGEISALRTKAAGSSEIVSILDYITWHPRRVIFIDIVIFWVVSCEFVQ